MPAHLKGPVIGNKRGDCCASVGQRDQMGWRYPRRCQHRRTTIKDQVPGCPPYPPCYYICASSPKHSKQERSVRTWVDGIRFLPPVKWGREYKLNDRKAKICTFFVHPAHWIKICTCYNSNRIRQLLQVGMAVPMLRNSCSDLALCGRHLPFLTTASDVDISDSI